MHEIPDLDRRGLRDFGLVTGAIFVALFGLFFPWILNVAFPTWPWVLAAVLGVWGLAANYTVCIIGGLLSPLPAVSPQPESSQATESA